nr:MAG TPA: hyaluronidase [Bacteriophage sp.]
MANLGNTIVNGILRVNGKINASDVISAPSFAGALTGNADTATKLKTARTINTVSFDGSANITIPYLKSIDSRGAYKPNNMKNGYISSVFSTLGGLDGSASDSKWVDVIGLSTWGDNGGNGVNALVATKRTTDGQALYHYYGDFGATTWKSKKQIAYIDSNITGNANTATKLATARKINGVAFDGTKDITISTSDSTKLPLAGGTMTGTIKTAMNGSYLDGNNGTKAIINSTAAPSQYATLFRKKSTNGVFTLNGWSDNVLLAYTDDARITAGTNAVATGVKFFENGSLVPYLNNQQALGTSSYKWSNVYATTFTGALSGNASTATKLATARTISTTGDVTSSGTFDGSGNLALATRRRGASVGQSTNTTTNPWYKVASCVMGGAYEDRWITFLVNGASSDFSTRVGILKLRFRSSGTKLWESGALQWESVSSNITLANFVLAYKNGTDNVTVELWCKCESSYNGYHFDVLGEGSRVGRSSRDWTLYNTWTAGSQAALPTGYTTINSTLLTFSNPTNGNAASATKLATARTIGVSGVTGTAQSFNGTANIVIPITAVPASLLTGKSAIKGSEITNDKHWVPSSNDSVKNFVALNSSDYVLQASNLGAGTVVAITDANESYVTTQATSLTCDLPLDL